MTQLKTILEIQILSGSRRRPEQPHSYQEWTRKWDMHMTVWKSHTGHGSMRQYGTVVRLYWVCAHTHILSPLHNFFNHSIFETKLYKVIFQKNFIYNTCISSFSYINLYRSVCQSGMYSFLGVFMTVLLSLLWYYLKCHFPGMLDKYRSVSNRTAVSYKYQKHCSISLECNLMFCPGTSVPLKYKMFGKSSPIGFLCMVQVFMKTNQSSRFQARPLSRPNMLFSGFSTNIHEIIFWPLMSMDKNNI